MFNRHGWISSTVFYAALLTLPVLLYVFLYQGSRIDEATMRNFRSLDTAADRIKKALNTFRNVSRNYSLGVDSTLLNEISNECEQLKETTDDLYRMVKRTKTDSDLRLTTRALVRNPPIGNGRPSPPKLSKCSDEQLKIDARTCKHGVRFGPNKVVSHDCRRLRERDERVYEALKAAKKDDVIATLDEFGIEVSMDANRALDEPTRHLSMFFDDYFIADDDGNVVFSGKPPPLSHDEHRRHRASVPFASLASIKDLLTEEDPSPLAPLSSPREPSSDSENESIVTGHSIVRNIEVDDVDLSVFIHPFMGPSSKLYVIGVVLSSSLANEAIRLRLGPAVDATLAIAVLLTLLPILRFWTAGDRSIFRRFNLYSVGTSALAASALATALVSGMIYKARDGRVLDHHLARISNSIIVAFDKDWSAVEAGLDSDKEQMEKTIKQKAGQQEDGIGKSIFCTRVARRDDLAATGPRKNIPQNWWPTSSYLLDDDGQRAICKQYRSGNPLKLDLAFRDYYLSAKQNALSLYRIDSVVRGQKQVVASQAYMRETKGEPKRYVAVTIPKLFSVDDIVIPPPFQYAVIDKHGDTIFHSDEDRVSISNFIDDTGNDAAIHAAIAHGRAPTLDANYDGLRIRAHFRPLHHEVDWTLVVFRAHGMVDRVSSLATSLSVISWVAMTVGMFVLAAILVAVPRPYGRELLAEVVLTITDRAVGTLAAVFGALGLLASYLGDGDKAWLVGLALPAVLAGAIFALAWSNLGRPTERCDDGTKRGIGGRVLALASVVFSFSVAPMLGWQTYYQAQLSNGLVVYLESETNRALDEKVRDFREYAEDLGLYADAKGFRRYAVAVDRPVTRSQYLALTDVEGNEEELLKDSVAGFERLYRKRREGDGGGAHVWPPARLWPLLAYSPVTQRSVWYRAALEGPGGGSSVWWFSRSASNSGGRCGVVTDGGRERRDDMRGVRFASEAVDELVGCPVAHDVGISDLSMWLWFVILFVVAMFMFVCYSAVRTKFGYARRIDKLTSFAVDDFKQRSFKLLELVTRSERDVLELKEELSSEFVVKQLRWHADDIVWDEFRPNKREVAVSTCAPKAVVFVVENFREATDGWRSEELAAELAGKLDQAVIICSDVVPSYHMCPGTLDDRDGTHPVWGNEWLELLGSFELQLLPDAGEGEEVRCGDRNRTKDWKRWKNMPAVNDFLAEGQAHADFKHMVRKAAEMLARSLQGEPARSSLGVSDKWRRFLNFFMRWQRSEDVSERKERALRDFRAAAQSRFKVLWAVSSFDERAQLYALAHGGAPNMRRPAAISSLVSRGLVTAEDPIRLRSEAFGRFIVEDLDDSLDDWRRKGHGDWWRVTWLPLVLLAGLGLLFFINSNPEAVGVIAAIGAAFIGLVPVVTSLFRVGQFGQPTVSSGDE